MSRSGGWQGEAVAQTFTGQCTMMMPTYGDDGSHDSKVYQQQQQAAPPAPHWHTKKH